MSLPNRKDLRSDLDSKITTAMTGLAGVFDYFNKNPSGISPFCCIDSGSALYSLDGDDTLPTRFTIVIGFWARRDDSDGADDALDDAALNLANLIRKNYNARFKSESVTDYELLENVAYKFELHFVEFDVV